MDELGVATGVLTPALGRATRPSRSRSPTRTPAASSSPAWCTDPAGPTRNVRRIRELAEHPRFCMVRVAPLFTQVAIDDPKHYPVYQVCEELGIPVGINVGVPGPRVRSRVQHPELLEDVLIDFPDLVVIGAHMGHPVRRAAHELHAQVAEPLPVVHRVRAAVPRPGARRFMGTSTYRGRVLWGSDEPWFPMRRSLDRSPRARRSTTTPWPCSSAAPPAASSPAPERERGPSRSPCSSVSHG